ncbi:putative lipoprotein [Sandaracinus amylolyticus]|uniref:Putative lipoprotein n=2 Tax=Sandaracinus amylolyticus TaxID=927083 RepID=A0A0F6W8M6_9BACT|nr:putative lipoprotein [Sandaracinus amylolyticus]
MVVSCLLAVLASGCTCGVPIAPLEDVYIPSLDAGADAQLERPDGSTCSAETGEGCPCAAEGETRSCSTGGVGACGMGTQTCVVTFEFPVWGACGDVAEPSDETCNGVDDDCDGTLDEALGELTCGEGACRTTVPACASGVAQECTPLAAFGEACNGADDDCDGAIDEALGSSICGTGACEREVAACAEGVVGVCTPGAPAVESCDDDDDDCDGMIDEGLGTIACGRGTCARTVAACADGTPGVCIPGTAGSETCDGADDDCDGTIDEGFGTTVCGVGECRRVVLACSGSGGGTCTPGTPTAEICNGLDDDCDGTVDDGIAPVRCGVGACARMQAGCVGGVPATCTPGMPSAEACNGVDDDCDGTVDDGLPELTCGLGACRRTATACTSGNPGTCTPGTPGTEVCGNGVDDDCDGAADELCACDPAVDRDFDGSNECLDCDDANGAVRPGRAELCNGTDDDCDRRIDEAFDADRDTFGTCSSDPTQRDCDDTRASVYPGAPELCGADGRGDGIDQDCDGYLDELCNPCDPRDDDGDGLSECAGDCDDTTPNVSPRVAERCDGSDTDCNRFTVDNCGVSEPCNFSSGADVCGDDLLCGCVVGGGGMCTGNYVCTSFCEGSYTGALGAGCTATQTCRYRVTITDNLHGCAESTDPIGTLMGGAVCSGDAQCRSGDCDRYCIGPGCNTQRCVDYCTHHAPGTSGSCASGTVCEIVSVAGTSPLMYARCALDDNGTGTTGAACGRAGQPGCMWGAQSCVSGVCAQPCAVNAQCPSGTHCSVRGNATTIGTFGSDAPAAIRGMTAVETVPVCLANTGAGLHNRQAGAACAQNGDCESQLCERSLGVCIDLCTSDDSCPTGLGCELAYLRTPTGVVSSRVCLSASYDGLLSAL